MSALKGVISMALRLRKMLPALMGLGMVACMAAPATAHPQYGYGPNYYRPYHYPYAYAGPSVVIAPPPVYYAPPPPPPVYYAPPPAYYAPPPVYYAPPPYPRHGYYGRPGVSLNLRF